MDDKEQFKQEIIAEVMDILGRFDSIPHNVQKALARRFKLSEVPTVTAGSKAASSENQAVDEGGSGTYSVLGPPDSFKLLSNSDGTTIGYVAVWNS